MPVHDWIFHREGKLVIGGTSYTKELKKLSKYLGPIQELSKINKVIVIDKDAVDSWEKKVKKLEPKKDFDDPHIVAIVEVSGCRVVCTQDRRSDKYLQDKRFYSNSKKPSIYRTKKHAHLLACKNIARICQ